MVLLDHLGMDHHGLWATVSVRVRQFQRISRGGRAVTHYYNSKQPIQSKDSQPMQIFLHVGAQKTGTTALQKYVFPYLSSTFYSRYLQRDIIYGQFGKARNFLWSYEDLSGTPHLNVHPPVDNRISIADNLHDLFPEAKVILGTRAPTKWKMSLYRESVRQGNPSSWEEFSSKFDDAYLDWEAYRELLCHRFDSVHVYRHEDLVRDPQAVVEGICGFMNTTMTQPLHLPTTNEALTQRQTEWIRRVNRILKDPQYNPEGIVPVRLSRSIRRAWRPTASS